ncbi:MAG: iron-containing alcohol dehydrogenase, partial [Muribaculaceae bacterium]|nr:iron-containing alcohol dehydrogenase [Muribaculaceae bacterium]
MIDFSYCSPTRYIFGRGVESQVGELTAAMGVKKVLVVSGHGSARRSGLLDRVLVSICAAGVRTLELTGIDPNPTDDRVYEGIEI